MTSADQSELKLRSLVRDTATVTITLFFNLRPPDQLKRIPLHHSKPDLKAKLKGAPMTSLPFSEKCESSERRSASLVCDCARQLLEREASSSRLTHSALKKKSQVDAEAMSCRTLELLDEAAESAAAEAQSKRDAAIHQLRRETTEKQKGHTAAIVALQKKLDIEIAERTRLEASVAEMLEDTAAQCNAESIESLEAMKKRHASELSAVYSSANIVKNVDD